MSLSLAAIVIGLVITAQLAFWVLRPRGRLVVLASWPHPVWLYTQALAAVSKFPSKRKDTSGMDKPIQVMLTRPVHFSATRLRHYLTLAGFMSGTAGDVPLMYPIVEAFRLVMQAMLLPAFPFNVLGSVLARTQVVALRRIAADEKLMYSCRVEPVFRTTAKGHIEVDIVVEARSVGTAGATGGEATLAWRNITTVIILSSRRTKKEAPVEQGKAPAGPMEGKAEGEAASTEAAKPTVIDTWRLGPNTGRRYGMLNGDLNPIHLYPVTSALFGFKRPIAHALFLTGKAEASMRKAGLELRYPCTLTVEFKRPTLLPARLHCAWLGAAGSDAAVASSMDSSQGARFAVLTSDLSKEVLVGSVSCHREAVDKALAA
ncbi:hypothetical protein Vretimale_13393 [Volvox reticuliferus]|uniref:MaoC-like domain-containing protein n=1 Tax=Volvox reticuliferus TaxID=1737510 RepID=A0A8J4CUI8_9CHLO|nr:hypothetical protein Vretifemale_14000 [Volvox reticuliferus]GIM09562.1 hypothetical protein Vretimale_13393 [Volvox reticuliferus]